MLLKALTTAAVIRGAVAQRPSNTSICDYYTTALLIDNTAENQRTLLTLVVNTAVIDTTPNVGISVSGILASGTYNNTAINLAPYFSGNLASSNRAGSSGVAINFLDGGGAAPLAKNQPAYDESSNQYLLLTHLYEFFGVLLGCSMQGVTSYLAYGGVASMYEVHKFMDLSAAQLGYFIEQVALSAASFGVATADVEALGTALNQAFGYRCEPLETIIMTQGPQLHSICIDETCPLSSNATCSSYEAAVEPGPANSTSTLNSTSTSTPNSTSSSTSTAAKKSARVFTAGKIAGIVIGCFTGIAAAAFLSFFCIRRTSRTSTEAAITGEYIPPTGVQAAELEQSRETARMELESSNKISEAELEHSKDTTRTELDSSTRISEGEPKASQMEIPKEKKPLAELEGSG